MDTSTLEDIGLSHAEAKIYLTLLELGPSKAGPIIDDTELQSSTVYHVLGSLIKKGLMVDDGGRQFGWPDEQRHLGHSEIFGLVDADNPESVKAGLAWRQRMIQRALDGCITVPQMGVPIEKLGPLASNYHIWEGKVKQAFDPNGVAEFTGFSWVFDPPHWESYPAKKKPARSPKR